MAKGWVRKMKNIPTTAAAKGKGIRIGTEFSWAGSLISDYAVPL
jgi:hypothetical protein